MGQTKLPEKHQKDNKKQQLWILRTTKLEKKDTKT